MSAFSRSFQYRGILPLLFLAAVSCAGTSSAWAQDSDSAESESGDASQEDAGEDDSDDDSGDDSGDEASRSGDTAASSSTPEGPLGNGYQDDASQANPFLPGSSQAASSLPDAQKEPTPAEPTNGEGEDPGSRNESPTSQPAATGTEALGSSMTANFGDLAAATPHGAPSGETAAHEDTSKADTDHLNTDKERGAAPRMVTADQAGNPEADPYAGALAEAPRAASPLGGSNPNAWREQANWTPEQRDQADREGAADMALMGLALGGAYALPYLPGLAATGLRYGPQITGALADGAIPGLPTTVGGSAVSLGLSGIDSLRSGFNSSPASPSSNAPYWIDTGRSGPPPGSSITGRE